MIAVSIKNKDGLGAPLDPHFGRAHAFVIAVEADGEWTVAAELGNAAKDSPQGAGTAAAVMLSQRGVRAVISGQFGPKAVKALEAFNIKMWMAPEGVTARQALDMFREGALREMALKVY